MAEAWHFEPLVRDLVALLVQGDYAAVERRSRGVRLNAAALAGAVAGYGRRLVPLPPGPLPLDVVPIATAGAPAWSVAVPLWTAEEGRSDLALSLTLVAESPGAYRVEVDNLHVL